jgi:hypothetical protein
MRCRLYPKNKNISDCRDTRKHGRALLRLARLGISLFIKQTKFVLELIDPAADKSFHRPGPPARRPPLPPHHCRRVYLSCVTLHKLTRQQIFNRF